MKQCFIFFSALASAPLLMAYGVSPDRAIQGGQGQPGQSQPFQNTGNFQMQPAPQPSNNLAPGVLPPLQPQVVPTANAQTIENNIKNYKPADWAKAWEHVTLTQAKKLQADPTVLFADARSKAEYDQGHIPGAIPLPVGEFDAYYKKYESKIRHARKIVTYCHGIGCQLSDKCAQRLYVEHKMHNVAAFFGGWPQWQEAHLPIETGPEPKTR
jgi:rhodanese-related sulfurtransferase